MWYGVEPRLFYGLTIFGAGKYDLRFIIKCLTKYLFKRIRDVKQTTLIYRNKINTCIQGLYQIFKLFFNSSESLLIITFCMFCIHLFEMLNLFEHHCQ